jgi:pyruvate/2-oxoglutarate dehydrogenase complex dihydrolipoamide dehydrogenase (E3) component
MKALPRNLVVIGAGPVGLELSQAYARLGSKVIVLIKGTRLLNLEDADIVPYALAALERELTFVFDAQVSKVEKTSEGNKRLTVQRGSEPLLLDTDAILIAVGRQPNTDRLGIDHTGVQLVGEHVAVSKTLQTTIMVTKPSAIGTWAAG